MSTGEARPLRYAIGSIGTGLFTTTPSVLLLYYCTDILSIAPGIAALIVLAPKLASLMWDPFVGSVSDRIRTPWGRRTPFMAVGALGMAAGFVAVFAPPAMPGNMLALWVGVAYFLMTGFYSLYAVPYIAMPAEAGPTASARMVAWRMSLVMLGVILGAALAPMLVSAFGGGRGGYGRMALAVAGICVVAMFVPVFALKPAVATSVAATEKRQSLGRIFGAPEFLSIACAYLLQMGGASIISATMPYLATQVFARAESDVGVAMAAVLVCSIAAMPVWARVARKANGRRALMGAVGFYAAAAIAPLALVLTGAPWMAFVGSLAFVGVGFAGLQVLPFTLLAHVIRERAPTDEGFLTGVWTASEKIGLAIGPALTGFALQAMGAESPRLLPYFAAFAPAALTLLSLTPLVSMRKAAA